MTRHIKTCLLFSSFCILFTSLISFGALASDSTPLTICYEDKAFPPYLNGDADIPARNPGSMYTWIAKASAKTGFDVTFIRRPWLRCQNLLEQGQAHAIFVMAETPQRRQNFVFPSSEGLAHLYIQKAEYPLFTAKGGAFDPYLHTSLFNAEGFNFDFYQRIKKQGIGAPLGYISFDYLQQHNALTKHDVPFNKGFEMVVAGRIDGFVMEKQIGLYHLAEQKLGDKVSVSHQAMLSTLWYMPFNRDFFNRHQQQVIRLWREIAGFDIDAY